MFTLEAHFLRGNPNPNQEINLKKNKIIQQ